MRGDGLQVALWDFVEAVGGGGHVLVHSVEAGIHARLLGLPELSPRPFAVFTPPLRVLRVACESGCKTGAGRWSVSLRSIQTALPAL